MVTHELEYVDLAYWIDDDDFTRVTGPDMRAGTWRETPGLTILIQPHTPEKEPK